MSKKMYPEIRFRNPWLLIKALDPALRPFYKEHGWEELLTDEFIEERIKVFQNEWLPYEKQIIEGMCAGFDLEFKQNVIDIYVAPFRNSFSNPMFIASKVPKNVVTDIIAHELIHRLINDNTLGDVMMSGDEKHAAYMKIFGGEEEFVVYEHIAVHAGLKYLYLDVLNDPSRLERDIERCQKNEPYKKAWDYVERNDYREIMKKVHKEKAGRQAS